ncbi:PIG-L family deacetylase [Taibaiella lutea]|uniref:PIG-L family deacetylase n=1 Tax=Taibaiella lutea TaxID=2608001 RepID=A0A5M6CQQ4_9BACT|nr:PIG-L family deacetylase [Taibaiella lutea]KAA5536272.1 PIG-L family deacetylase [Taibaiella lutea]
MRKIFSLFLLSLIGNAIQAQQYRPMPSSEIFQKLQQLNVLGTVMYVAAHPDDENTRLLSYLVHHDHVQTIYLSLTRGDGGQNILGNEQGSVLGLIRTHELMEARKIDGAEQLFTHVIDFGFTKSPEETFKFWNRTDLDADVKQMIEKYRPDVVICRFPTTGEGGHGQHTVSAIVAGDVYQQLEANKKQHPDDKEIWLPKRLLFNSFRFGDNNTTSEDQFKLPINQYDPLLGEGYGEMAGRSRSVHKSQGAGTPQTVGVANDYFKLLGGSPIANSLYDDIDITWNRVGHPEIGQHIQQVLTDFDFNNPSLSIPKLTAIYKEIGSNVKDDFWKRKKLEELNDIIVSCAGIMVEALTDQQEQTEGAIIPVKMNVIARSAVPVKLQSFSLSGIADGNGMPAIQMVSDSLYQYSFKMTINDPEQLTQPYWMKYGAANSAYQYEPQYNGLPEAVSNPNARVFFEINGQQFGASVPVSYKKLDPVKGDVVQQLRIVPAVSVEPYHNLFIYEKGKSKKVWVHLKVFKAVDSPILQVTYKDKVIISKAISNLVQGQDTTYTLDIPTTTFTDAAKDDYIMVSVKARGKVYDKTQHLIQYPHLPDLQYFTASWMHLVKKNWNVAVKKIGYIEGAGDYVDDILKLAGLQVEIIPESSLSNAQSLAQYDAVVVGVRALNVDKQSAAWMPVLMKYVEEGGTVLMQYNTNGNLQTKQYGPYPFIISRDRVTDEEAKVTFTDTTSSLMHFPNEITESDFKDWVQERGIYFPSGFESNYKSLFSMHDGDEKPLNGAVIYTPYGKGQYIYSPLVFFRELPAGNVGSIRLMMNLLSAGKGKP